MRSCRYSLVGAKGTEFKAQPVSPSYFLFGGKSQVLGTALARRVQLTSKRIDERHKEKPYWETAIIRVERNKLVIRGYNIEDLIGRVSYAEMVYLEVMGELPSAPIAHLLEAVLVAGCDFGVYSPAIASARMAATCGITFNSCLATGINLLGNIHGGASEEAMRIFYEVDERGEAEARPVQDIVGAKCEEYRREGRFLPGYGHPVNDNCPRVRRLFELGEQAARSGAISGRFIDISRRFETALLRVFGKKIPINADAAFAAIQCEIGLPPEIAKGLVSLSRGIGLLAHVYEELKSGSRLKSPCPRYVLETEFVYTGPPERPLPKSKLNIP